MKIKSFLLLIYGVAGLVIALFTAIMTYIIIDEPIGFKMTSKIALTILATLPIIGIFSYLIGSYLSKKFEHISLRLDAINEDKFLQDTYEDKIEDITEIHHSIHQLSFRLEESIQELQENNQNLSSVIKSLSHDTKTPLTIIDGYLEEFEDGLIKLKQIPKVISILKKETAYLHELGSEVIGYIQSQELTLSKEKIYLKSFIESDIFPLLRVQKSVKLDCKIDDNIFIEFNQLALKKIFINLLHNASKYTHSGNITIKNDSKTIIIEDTGIGINPKYCKTIFEPFVCLDESRNREKNGFGLGLSIAKNLALSNGYELVFDCAYDDGCRFLLKKIISR